MKLNKLKPGVKFEGIVGVRNKSFNTGSNNSTYITLIVCDSTTSLEAKIWDAGRDIFDGIREGQPLKITATTNIFKDKLQLKIESISQIKASDNFNPESLMAESKEYTLQSLDKEYNSIKQHWLIKEDQALLNKVLSKKELLYMYRNAPAGKTVHHAAKHGLFAHSIAVARLCLATSEKYSVKIDKSLLTLGALLHDIGKAYEYDWGATTVFTNSGRLLGHPYIGAHIVHNACIELKVSGERTVQLIHLILSHAGKREFGAVQPPQTIEANILHYCDNIDAQLDHMRELQSSTTAGAAWSERDRILDNIALYFGERHGE